MKKSILFVFVFLISLSAFGQPPVEWQKCFGGSSSDGGGYNALEDISVQQTSEGGYIVSGHSETNNDGDVTGHHGTGNWFDYWIVKCNSIGVLQWQKSLGGINHDLPHSIYQTWDGGYVITGATYSNDGDVTGYHGNTDNWIVKLDGNGNIQWQRCYGGTSYDVGKSIQQTSDGGYIVAGGTSSNDGDASGQHGNGDMWILKLGSNGVVQWQKCLGGTEDDGANSIQQTFDGGYIVAGNSRSNDNDLVLHTHRP